MKNILKFSLENFIDERIMFAIALPIKIVNI
jgi:hypothetical protein